jgi:hypothetical protein
MPTKKNGEDRWDLMWPWIEPAVAAVVGIILYFPLQRKDLAEVTWILGLLLSFGNLATSRRLKEELNVARKLSEVVDLSTRCNLQEIHKILNLYISITETEFHSLKDDILEDCVSRLRRIAYDKEIDVGSGEYHLWLRDMLRTTSKNEQITAVSVMTESAWVEISSEKQYLDENIAAVKRGVKIDRIFISSKDKLRDPKHRQVLYAHMENFNEGMTAYVVWQEDLAIQDPALIGEIGAGFVQFGERVALIDTSVPPQEARGNVTMKPAQLKKCRRLFERLKLHALIADQSLFNQLGEGAILTNVARNKLSEKA